ncbi:helix-turn-helix domain-containing protein [Lacrimispora sp. 210928-DFI.3.58]|nr:helix-turn-helix domain-containing protein [Lacrimispora sp. 210928-DFI.3.58]
MKGQGRKEADEERAARLQEKGLSVREIAQKLGKSKTTVQRLLKAYGQREKTE